MSRYRRNLTDDRLGVVTAIQFSGPNIADCRRHAGAPDDDGDDLSIEIDGAPHPVAPSQWIVRDALGGLSVVEDDVFRAYYTAI